ncbi:MAG: hypothetical protein HN341_18640 [Verrucomicrobia bacterium]|nr:hypothetical protein [Verrucomicrobiota bacterium]
MKNATRTITAIGMLLAVGSGLVTPMQAQTAESRAKVIKYTTSADHSELWAGV